MGKFRLEITDPAKKQIAPHHKSGDKGTLTKLSKILLELTVHPFEGVGNPEKLKHNLSDFWSRRINLQDRIIYSVNENLVLVKIVSAMGHYTDK
jgi:toxin YoeB